MEIQPVNRYIDTYTEKDLLEDIKFFEEMEALTKDKTIPGFHEAIQTDGLSKNILKIWQIIYIHEIIRL